MTSDFIGTLPGWITAASTTTGVVALVAAYWRRGIQLRGLDDKRDATLQEHMDAELDRMQAVVDGLRGRVDQQDKDREDERRKHREEVRLWEKRWKEQTDRSDECEKERADMRRELDGLKRQIADKSANHLLFLEGKKPSEVAPAATASASRVKKITGGTGK